MRKPASEPEPTGTALAVPVALAPGPEAHCSRAEAHWQAEPATASGTGGEYY